MVELNPDRVFFVRWLGCVAILWMMDAAGGYTFPSYSSALKEALAINQAQLNWLSFAKDVGDVLAVVTGIVANYVPLQGLLVIGAVIGMLGYGAQWLVVCGAISPLPFWLMLGACLMGGYQMSWINVSTFTACMRNFPQNRGSITGLFKGNMGLSAAIYSMLCDYLFSGSASTLLLLVTLLPSGTMILSAFLFRSTPAAESKAEKNEETQIISYLYTLSISLAVFLTIAEAVSSDSDLVQPMFLSILFLLLASPVSILLKRLVFKKADSADSLQIYGNFPSEALPNEETEDSLDPMSPRDGIRDREASEISLRKHLLRSYSKEYALSHGEAEEGQSGTGCCSCGTIAEVGEDISSLQLLRNWTFYGFYFSCLCATGSGMAFNNNMGQVGESLGFSSVTVFTSCYSLGNFCGRIVAGAVSEYYLRKAAIPRLVWTALGKIPMLGVLFWLATGSGASMYVGSIVVGFAQGVHITLVIPVVCEYYGLKNFGTNFAIVMTSQVLGSFLLSEVLAGNVYDYEASKQQGIGWWIEGGSTSGLRESVTCYGAECYRATFIVMGSLLIMATAVDLVLAFVGRSVYKKLQETNKMTG